MSAAELVTPDCRLGSTGGVTLLASSPPRDGRRPRREGRAFGRRKGLRRAPWARAAAILIAVLLLAAVARPTAADVRQTAQEVLSDQSFQTELPLEAREDDEAERPEGPSVAETILRWLGEWLTLPPGLAGFLRLLLWAAVLASAALLIFFLLNELPRLLAWRRATLDGRGGGVPGALPGQAEGQSQVDLLEEADRLARQGWHGKAIHLLLLHSLEHLRTRLDARIDPSLTGREIVSRLSLEEDARSALARIVAASEVDYFGGRSSSESDYESCRKDFGRLARSGSE